MRNISRGPAVLLLVAFLCSPAQASGEKEKYQSAIDKGNFSRAEQIARKWEKKRGLSAKDSLEANVMIAKALRLQGEPGRAISHLEKLGFAAQGKELVRYELAQCHRSQGSDEKAMQLYELVRHAKSLNGMFATYECAELHFDGGEFKTCIKRCEDVIRRGKKWTGPELTETIQKAKDLLKRAQDALRQFGPDFEHYRQARMAESRRKWSDAIRHYEQIESGVLKEAAGCYLPDCHVAQGKFSKAGKLYTTYVKSSPQGLYRGEALYRLARMRCLQSRNSADFKKVKKILDRALTWVQESPEVQKSSKLGEPLQKILEEFPPPQSFVPRGGASVAWWISPPEAVINQLTAKWYLPHLEMQVRLLRVFVDTELGDIRAALSELDKVAQLNDEIGGRYLAHKERIHRIRTDINRGAFLVPREIWKGAQSSRNGNLIRFACFNYVAGENTTALDIFTYLGSRTHRLSRNDDALCTFGLGCCAFGSADNAKAIEYFEAFDGKLSTTQIAPVGRLYLANILIGQKKTQSRAEKLYKELSKVQGLSNTGARSILALAVARYNRGDHEGASSACKQLFRRHKNSPFGKAGATLYQQIDEKFPAQGRVVDIEQTLVLPGKGEIIVDYSDIEQTDVIQYRITARTRTECMILRQFGMRLSEFEPQPLAFNGIVATFLRVPALYRITN